MWAATRSSLSVSLTAIRSSPSCYSASGGAVKSISTIYPIPPFRSQFPCRRKYKKPVITTGLTSMKKGSKKRDLTCLIDYSIQFYESSNLSKRQMHLRKRTLKIRPIDDEKPRWNRGFSGIHLFCIHLMVRPEGFEPPAFGIGIHCDIQLRHGRIDNARAYPTALRNSIHDYSWICKCFFQKYVLTRVMLQ